MLGLGDIGGTAALFPPCTCLAPVCIVTRNTLVTCGRMLWRGVEIKDLGGPYGRFGFEVQASSCDGARVAATPRVHSHPIQVGIQSAFLNFPGREREKEREKESGRARGGIRGVTSRGYGCQAGPPNNKQSGLPFMSSPFHMGSRLLDMEPMALPDERGLRPFDH